MSSTNGKQNGKALAEQKPQIWKPGQSGNPSGRPKNAVSLAAAIRRELAIAIETGDHLEARSRADALAQHLVDLAMGDDAIAMQAAKIVADKADPKELAISIGEHASYTRDETQRLGRLAWGDKATIPV